MFFASKFVNLAFVVLVNKGSIGVLPQGFTNKNAIITLPGGQNNYCESQRECAQRVLKNSGIYVNEKDLKPMSLCSYNKDDTLYVYTLYECKKWNANFKDFKEFMWVNDAKWEKYYFPRPQKKLLSRYFNRAAIF